MRRDEVLQLADVAGPGVVHEHLHGLGRHLGVGPRVLRRVLPEEVLGEHRNLVAPLAQRRQVDRDDVEAEEEVVAELAVGARLRQILVGRGDDADVHADVLLAAEARELADPAGPAAAWPAAGTLMSPISSRKIVPLLANSNLPGFC